MPYTATITEDNVTLPNGNTYQTGDKVLLTDEQYAQMSDTARAAVLSGVAAIDTDTTIPAL